MRVKDLGRPVDGAVEIDDGTMGQDAVFATIIETRTGRPSMVMT